jgi:hypothetical protein
LVDLRARYVLLIAPPLVLLFVYGVFNIYLRTKRPGYLYIALLLPALYHGYYVYEYVQLAAPLGYLIGNDTRAGYLRRALPEYATFEYINNRLPLNARIYLVFIGRRGYYCERDYFHDGGELPAFLAAAITASEAPEQIAESCAANGSRI